MTQPPRPLPDVGASLPAPPASTKREQSPSPLPLLPLPAPSRVARARATAAPGLPWSSVRCSPWSAVLASSPPPIFARGELASISSFSPSNSRFESWPVGLYPRSPECSMPPAMAPAPGLPLRPSSRRGREPPYPPISRVSSVAILVDRRLLTARASGLHAAGHGLPRRSHCSGRPKPPRLIRTVHRAINGRK